MAAIIGRGASGRRRGACSRSRSGFGEGPVDPDSLRVNRRGGETAASRLEPESSPRSRRAASNVRAVAEAAARRGATGSELSQGQTVELREVPVASAGIYAPGGTAAYPSTVLMGCIPAKVAGVERVAVATPPGADGRSPTSSSPRRAIAGADEVYAIGGAQAIAALALGTETIAPVDVIAGPGNRYVQEAKRQLVGRGRDRRDRRPLGADGDRRRRRPTPSWSRSTSAPRPSTAPTACWSPPRSRRRSSTRSQEQVERARGRARASRTRRWRWSRCRTPRRRVALANAIAPEHLELVTRGRRAAGRARSRTAGCVFVGERGADRLRRLRRRLQPRAAHRRRRPLPGAARARRRSGAGSRRSRSRRTRPGRWRRRSLRWPAPRASRCTRESARARAKTRSDRR